MLFGENYIVLGSYQPLAISFGWNSHCVYAISHVFASFQKFRSSPFFFVCYTVCCVRPDLIRNGSFQKIDSLTFFLSFFLYIFFYFIFFLLLLRFFFFACDVCECVCACVHMYLCVECVCIVCVLRAQPKYTDMI